MYNAKIGALLLMILLDGLLVLFYTINIEQLLSFGHALKYNSSFVYAMLKQTIIFMVVYFIFKKASKEDIDKKKWINLVQFVFMIGVIINFLFRYFVNLS